MARKARLRKREILIAFLIGGVVAFGATGIVSDGFGGPGSMFESHQEAPKEPRALTDD